MACSLTTRCSSKWTLNAAAEFTKRFRRRLLLWFRNLHLHLLPPPPPRSQIKVSSSGFAGLSVSGFSIGSSYRRGSFAFSALQHENHTKTARETTPICVAKQPSPQEVSRRIRPSAPPQVKLFAK